MTDAVETTLIANAATIVTLLLSRWMSHTENKKTSKVLGEVHVMVNDRLDVAVNKIKELEADVTRLKGNPPK